MAITFPRFSSLSESHFHNARLAQRMAALSVELEASKRLIEHQCLLAVVMVTTVVYLLARFVESGWALPFIVPVIAFGAASMQHTLTLYRHHVRRESLPAICEGIGRLRYTIGEAPDICLERMVRADLLPRHGQSLIEDAVFGEYRGRHLSVAMVNLWQGREEIPIDHDTGDLFHGVVVTIRWPERPHRLPADELMPLIDDARLVRFGWFEGHLLLAIPCRQSPFHLAGLFARPEKLIAELFRAAAVIQIPHRLIDFIDDGKTREDEASRSRESA